MSEMKLNPYDQVDELVKWSKDGEITKIATYFETNDTSNIINSELGRKSLNTAILQGHLDIARILIHNGADIHRKDKDGVSLLYNAITNEKLDIAKLLFEHGAQVSITNRYEKLLLHHVCKSCSSIEIIPLLLAAGFDVNYKSCDRDHQTPLHTAIKHGHYIASQQLLDLGADINSVDSNFTYSSYLG
jgi:ankyrin repeat protein